MTGPLDVCSVLGGWWEVTSTLIRFGGALIEASSWALSFLFKVLTPPTSATLGAPGASLDAVSCDWGIMAGSTVVASTVVASTVVGSAIAG